MQKIVLNDLKIDEGDDDGEYMGDFCARKYAKFLIKNDTGGSQSTLWQIGTNGVVRQKVNWKYGWCKLNDSLRCNPVVIFIRVRANVSSSANGGLIEDGNSSADLYKVVWFKWLSCFLNGTEN